jgi:hypothetical protein
MNSDLNFNEMAIRAGMMLGGGGGFGESEDVFSAEEAVGAWASTAGAGSSGSNSGSCCGFGSSSEN